MNKQDKVIVGLLIAVLMAWMFSQSQKAPTVPVAPPADPQQEQGGSPSGPGATSPTNAAVPAPEQLAPPVLQDPVPAPALVEMKHEEEEVLVSVSNSNVEVTVSSWGACIKEVSLLEYRESVEKDSQPVTLDFAAAPVLSVTGVDAWSTKADFSVISSTDSNVVMESKRHDVTLRRSISVGDSYALSVRDEFIASDGASRIVPAHSVEAGSMTKVKSKSSVRGMTYISLDSAPFGDDIDVTHWSKTKSEALDGEGAAKMRLEERLQPEGRQGGCGMFKPKLTAMLPAAVELDLKEKTQWVAVKNKFFLSVLTPEEGASGLKMSVRRLIGEKETPEDSRSWSQRAEVEEVSAQMLFEDAVIPEAASYVRNYTCYIGPKKYKELKKLGDSYGDIMQFGFWSPLSRILLTTLNAIHAVFRNYGVAIILLTMIVRLIFWPITHKSTESMKRMQAIQPEIKKIQAKYKDNPNKLNQATMALYKEHKVNPMAGCLPMFIQIPVFFALFTVLRSAVELRFAEFLWIRDLSEQEGLLANVLPIPLNILPLVMTVLTLFQQKMTPTAGDPQQQKMMMFMPVMFLFLFYPMPSALVLYWTTSQLIALLQLVLQRRKKQSGAAAAKA